MILCTYYLREHVGMVIMSCRVNKLVSKAFTIEIIISLQLDDVRVIIDRMIKK